MFCETKNSQNVFQIHDEQLLSLRLERLHGRLDDHGCQYRTGIVGKFEIFKRRQKLSLTGIELPFSVNFTSLSE